MDFFSILTLLGGLAMFLYGMQVMGDGLAKVSGGKLEQILENLTSSKWKAVLLGMCVTAVIQSSSATTVMVVGFVNSGIMKLTQAVGIIMGANIGTSITGWILCLSYIDGSSGIAQLLSNFILGKNKVEITQVTSDTRESVLQNGQVDAVFATYTITDERKKLVSFAGPYYYTQQAILVLADNDDIKSVDDLADKNVAVQSGSNGPAILEEFAPKASQQEFKTDEEARQALQQGRVDAYVIDNNMQQSALVREPGKYKIAGKPFGSKEPYGIGLPLDSDGVAFVNDFLKKIEDDGTWTELWQICIGDRTGDTNVPELPEVGA